MSEEAKEAKEAKQPQTVSIDDAVDNIINTLMEMKKVIKRQQGYIEHLNKLLAEPKINE